MYKVKKGESFYIKTNKTHYIENAGKTTARLLWVSTPRIFSQEAGMDNAIIQLNNITKKFDGEIVLDDITLSVKENEFVTFGTQRVRKNNHFKDHRRI